MNFISRLVDTFRKPPLHTRLLNLCCPDNRSLRESEVSLLTSELLSQPSPLTVVLETVQQLNRSPSICRVKFMCVILMSQEGNSFSMLIGSVNERMSKQPLSMKPLDKLIQSITNQLLYYLVRCNKEDYKQRVKGCEDSTLAINRVYINLAYKFINELSYLFVLTQPFHQLFSKYSDFAPLEQLFNLTAKEINSLYECFKQSMAYYFTGFDREQVMEGMAEINELMASNKHTYQRMKQFYSLSDMLDTRRRPEGLVSCAEMPQSVSRWFSKIAKTDREGSKFNIQNPNEQSMPSLYSIATEQEL